MSNSLRLISIIGSLAVIVLIGAQGSAARAKGLSTASIVTDANTLLSLRFENSLSGDDGEQPVSAVGHSFEPGVQGQAVSLPPGSQLFYPAANNIDAREGTIEFWIKPSWNLNQNQTHTILDWGGSYVGGMRLDIHSLYRNIVLSLDTFAGWRQVEANISSWTAGEWHHVAVTYSNTSKRLQIYLDGSKKAELEFNGHLPLINHPNIQIGGAPGNSNPVDAVLDEFRISNRVRTEQDITQSFLNPLAVDSLTITTVTKTVWPTWKIPLTITANTNVGSNMSIPVNGLSWTSSPANSVAVDSSGNMVATTPGNAKLTAALNGVQTDIDLMVVSPTLSPKIEIPTGFRSDPANGSLYEMPVVSFRYIPTANGVDVDTSWAPGYWGLEPITVADLEQKLDKYDEIRKFMLEEGSRYRDYGTQASPPSLSYRVVATITVYEPTPPGRPIIYRGDLPLYHPEMFQMFERWGIADYVNELGVKEIWFWTGQLEPGPPSYDPAIHPPENFRSIWESNMSSPTTGDVSNSNRDNTDLPVYDHTYLVMHQSMRRLDTLTLHIDGHQWEQALMHVNFLRDGNNHLVWRNFAGWDASAVFRRGRAGWTHHLPNNKETTDGNMYDYHDLEVVASDIKDWKPNGGGTTIQFSAMTLQDTPYAFPNNFLQSPGYGGSTPMAEPHWYIFWRQSMPGRNNTIPYETSPSAFDVHSSQETGQVNHDVCIYDGNGSRTISLPRPDLDEGISFDRIRVQKWSSEFVSSPTVSNRMTNWWHFMGDWDRAIKSGMGLYESASCNYSLSSTSQSFPAAGGTGSITVTAPAGCKWFASNNAMWTPLVSGDLGNGTGTVDFNVLPNTSEDPRATSIVIAGQPFSVEQAKMSNTASISGKVVTPEGLGLRNAVVSFIDSTGAVRATLTNQLGFYSFHDLRTGKEYTLRATSKRYRFQSRVLTLNSDLENVEFVGLE